MVLMAHDLLSRTLRLEVGQEIGVRLVVRAPRARSQVRSPAGATGATGGPPEADCFGIYMGQYTQNMGLTSPFDRLKAWVWLAWTVMHLVNKQGQMAVNKHIGI